MITHYGDWSMRTGVNTVTKPTQIAKVHRNLMELLADVKPGDRIVLESTFEAFATNRRGEFLDAAEKKGVAVFTVPPRMTGKGRRRNAKAHADPSLAIKTDENDARAICYLVWTGQHLSNPRLFGLGHKASEAAREKLMHLRREGTLVNGPRGGLKYTSGKDVYAARLIAQLPAFEGLSATQKLALGDGKGHYSLVTVAAAGVATDAAEGSRKVFDQISGLYSHAYPAQIRADLMHWSWAGGNKREKLEDHYKESGVGLRKDGLTITDFRREVRWLFHQLKHLDTSV